MRRFLLLFAGLWIACSSISGTSFYLSPDVPTDLSGNTYLPDGIVRWEAGAYFLSLSLPAGTPLNGLYRRLDGQWLISVEAPTDLGGTTYEPYDVILYDPTTTTYSLFFCGGPIGIPAGSDIDALLMVGGDKGDLILSFDVPTDLSATGGSIYMPSDLVKFTPAGGGCSGWTISGLFFDSGAAGVPLSSNVTAADERGILTILSFDVPTTLGSNTYMPGELVSWNSSTTTFASFYLDASWPISSRIDAFCFLAGPGKVPPTIMVEKSLITPGDLTISWSTSCSAGAEDYGIHEGTIGIWYDHTYIDCYDDSANLNEEFTPSSGNQYYLVVPHNPNDEGSYGTKSIGVERPQGVTPCQATQELGCP
jgi:hypothetical protein